MKILEYAGTTFRTGDEIVAALFEYSAALAEAGSAGSVDIPVLTADGRRVTATLLVGPASQIVATDAASPDDELVDELVDEPLVRRLRARTRSLNPVAAPLDDTPIDDDFE